MHSAAPAAETSGARPHGSPARFPVAASIQVRPLLDGPSREARVLGAFPEAAYLGVDDAPAGRDVLALLSPRAVRQPVGAVLPAAVAASLRTLAAPGTLVLVGGGRVLLGSMTLHPARWWDPRPVAPPGHGWASVPVPPLPQALHGRGSRLIDGLHGPTTCAEPSLRRLEEAAWALVGAGPGLTPAGDDVLCGALAALQLAGHRLAGPLAAVVRRLAPARTTRLSAALLVAAADGGVLPELTALLTAPTPETAAAALHRLLDVGHTSGACLAAGALLALRAVTTGISYETSETLRAASGRDGAAA